MCSDRSRTGALLSTARKGKIYSAVKTVTLFSPIFEENLAMGITKCGDSLFMEPLCDGDW